MYIDVKKIIINVFYLSPVSFVRLDLRKTLKHSCADLIDLNASCTTNWLNQLMMLLDLNIMSEKISRGLKFTDNFAKDG